VTTSTLTLVPAAISSAGQTQLLLAAAVGIATVVLLISAAKFHPFLALILGTAALGIVAAVPAAAIIDSFTKGFGSTVGTVGLLIALGAMVGKLLADSGGADQIVDTIIGRVGERGLPWAMALIAAILGLPLFFEVGVVLLVPVVILVARRTGVSLMKVGIPALAGLSVLHGLVPPHPGPLAAISSLNADLGTTLLLGLLVAVPTLIVSGPVLASVITRWVPVATPGLPGMAAGVEAGSEDALVGSSVGSAAGSSPGSSARAGRSGSVRPQAPGGSDAGLVGTQGFASSAPRLTRRPSFAAAIITITLPVVLMLARAIAEIGLPEGNGLRSALDVVGNPPVALLAAVLVAMFALGRGSGMNRRQIEASLGGGLPGIASILLIVAAGGGFKQMLVDAGVGNVIGDMAKGANLSPLLLGWLVAAAIRVGTGSATVATITAAGIVAPLAADMSRPDVALLVLAVGCGSLFFSHVNDAGFWLVKEYFGMTVGETIRSWSVMETVISVVGVVFVLLVSLVV
jgi:gluconate:H+ symporter, GntP family